MKKYFLDLFAGIGGFALGAEWAGMTFDGHYFSEVDEYAISVYQHRFPDAINLGDIRTIGGGQLPSGDWIIAGGFPCQDISVAGKGTGLDGGRSGLWFEYARIIGELRPRFAIMENVGALTIRGLDRVLGSLAALGYDAEWQDIRASDVGAPHRRERIWIVGYPNGQRFEEQPDGFAARARDVDGECSRENVPDAESERRGARRTGRPSCDSPRETEQSFGIMADACSKRDEPHGITRELAIASEPPQGEGDQRERSGNAINYSCEALADAEDSGNVRRDGELEPTEREMREYRRSSKDGRREWWAVEPDVGRVAHGIPARVDRLKCLGNSIVPEIAELIFYEIREALI